jgi:hypothetical protein
MRTDQWAATDVLLGSFGATCWSLTGTIGLISGPQLASRTRTPRWSPAAASILTKVSMLNGSILPRIYGGDERRDDGDRLVESHDQVFPGSEIRPELVPSRQRRDIGRSDMAIAPLEDLEARFPNRLIVIGPDSKLLDEDEVV